MFDKKAYMKIYCSTPEFKEKDRARTKKWRSGNKEKIKELGKKYYQQNKDKIKEASKAHREANRDMYLVYLKAYRENPLKIERIREQKAKWFKDNHDRVSLMQKQWNINNVELKRLIARKTASKRRALLKGCEGDITLKEINKLIEDSNNVCFWCDKEIDIMHLDHIYPLSKGGGHTISNLCVSCADCNRKKHDKDPEVWLEEILQEAKASEI